MDSHGSGQSPVMRKQSGTASSTPLRRVSSAAGHPVGRVVGLGLLDSSSIDLSDGDKELWPESSSSEESHGVVTAPPSPNRLSPRLLFSPEAGSSTENVVTLTATDANLRSPRSSALLDPSMAGQSGRRSSISHASHSSTGSASSFHSTLSIRMDEPTSTATSRNPSNNYWLASPTEKPFSDEKYLDLPRAEKRCVHVMRVQPSLTC
jgi:hypothetical protein